MREPLNPPRSGAWHKPQRSLDVETGSGLMATRRMVAAARRKRSRRTDRVTIMEVPMSTFKRLGGAALLLAVAGFCGFGFLATFEPLAAGNMLAWRWGYGVTGPTALAVAVLLAAGAVRRRTHR
jgi:hypothetical protein